MKTKIAITITSILSLHVGFSQGFVNLDFEAAKITGLIFNEIPAANAFPGWTVTANTIYYDDVALSGNSISIIDTNPPDNSPPIQGIYYALLVSNNYPGPDLTTSLGQTGQVPRSAQTISFWGNIGSMQITFSGQPLSFFVTDTTPNYSIYEADISAYAGQTGQLLFSLPAHSSPGTLDNILFSSTPVPEPGAFGLFVLGGVMFGLRHRKKNSR